MSITVNALERKMQFIDEQRTEPYQEYGEGVGQTKIVYYAKSGLQKRALPVLERQGA